MCLICIVHYSLSRTANIVELYSAILITPRMSNAYVRFVVSAIIPPVRSIFRKVIKILVLSLRRCEMCARLHFTDDFVGGLMMVQS